MAAVAHGRFDQKARLFHRIADHADDVVFAPHQAGQSIADQFQGRWLAHVEGRGDLARYGRGQHQFAHVVAAQDDVKDFGIGQKFLFDRLVDHVPGRQPRQRRNLGTFQARQDVVLTETRDRRHEDQNFGQHDEQRRQDQEAPGQGLEGHAPPFMRAVSVLTKDTIQPGLVKYWNLNIENRSICETERLKILSENPGASVDLNGPRVYGPGFE